MLVALETKNKDKVVLGIFSCPPSHSPLHEAGKRCNRMVIYRLTRSMTPTIKQSVMWMDSRSEIWNNIHQSFSHGDKFIIYKKNFKTVGKVITQFLYTILVSKLCLKNFLYIEWFLFAITLLHAIVV